MKKTIAGRFQVDDLQPILTADARDAMLDLVLRWASLDGAVSQLFAAAFGKIDEEHADEVTNEKMSVKLRKIELALRPMLPGLAATISKLKKQAERYGQLRDTIAHCHCAGMLKSKPDYIIFLRYRRHKTGGLIVDAIPIEKVNSATQFAEHLRKTVQKLDSVIRGKYPTDHVA